MTRARLRLIAVVLVAFGLLVSSCFQIRAIKIAGPKALSPGGVTAFRIDQFKLVGGTDYPFLLVGLQDLDYVSTTNFDLKGNWGGPFAVVSDDALRNLLLAGDTCSSSGVSATDVDAAGFDEWVALRTLVQVNEDLNVFNQNFRSKLTIKREAGTSDGNSGSIAIFSGVWDETDGDNTAEAGETFICTSAVMTGIPFQP